MRTGNSIYAFVRIALISLFLLFAGKECFAQDILLFKSGKELKVIITAEDANIVKYREFSDQTGPEYSVRKDQIESITYKKSQKETKPVIVEEKGKSQTQVSATQKNNSTEMPGLLVVKKRFIYRDGVIQSTRNVKTLMQDNVKALELYEKGAKQCALSNSCAFGVILSGLLVVSMNGKTDDPAQMRSNAAVGLIIDGVFVTTAVVLVSSGKKKIRSAADIYNEGIRSKQVTYKLDFGIQENGIGLALKF